MNKSEFLKNFVVFILTHGRADNVMTYKTLRKHGYTGRVVFVLDDEDKQTEQYYKNYGKENCFVFCKEDYVKSTDNIQRGNRGVIVYARNACFDIARDMGYKFFIELDDDYYGFSWKFNSRGLYMQRHIMNLDYVLQRMLEYYISVPILTLAMAQCGDFVGGSGNQMAKTIGTKRKAMNSFICSIDRPFKFIDRINEDVNTYTLLSTQGYIFLTLAQVALNQVTTQANSGGMSEAYWREGTYQKSFSTVVVAPTCAKLSMMGNKYMRLHHNVLWKFTAPKILNPKYRKE